MSDTSPAPSNLQAFLKILNDGKWWLAQLASLISILLVSKYLWVVGHPELILSVISTPSSLLVWFIYAVLTLLALMLVFVVPSAIYVACMGLVKAGREHEPQLARHFFGIIGVGCGLMSLNLLASLYGWAAPPALLLGGMALVCAVLMRLLLGRHLALAQAAWMLAGPYKPWRQTVYRWLRLLWLGVLLAVAALGGVMPTQVAIMTWRGPEYGVQSLLAIPVFFVVMMLYLVPALTFYVARGSQMKRVSRAVLGMLGAIFFNAMLLPTLSDLWVYSAANLVKMRDSRSQAYVLEEKDYPKALFEQALWARKPVVDAPGLFSVDAFRQFRFGDVLLLCPGRYAMVSLKNLDSYTASCIAISEAKVKVIVPRAVAPVPQYPVPACLAAPAATPVPLTMQTGGRCLSSGVF